VVGLAYQHLVRLFASDLSEGASIEAVLKEASRIAAREGGRLHA
jgi:hypothetical protein